MGSGRDRRRRADAELDRPGFLAVAQRLRGQLAEAERGFASSIAGWQAAAQPTVTAWSCHDLSQVQRAQGRLDAAVSTCQQALEITTPAWPAPPTAGPAHVELAEVAFQRNDLDAALRHVAEGIALCRRLIYTPPLAVGYLGRLARSFEPGTADAEPYAAQRAPGARGLVEPLSEREREVLRLLAAGKPNQEIAGELVVSLHTVKKHVTHVLGKLGATNRTEATARARTRLAPLTAAREPGLLPATTSGHRTAPAWAEELHSNRYFRVTTRCGGRA